MSAVVFLHKKGADFAAFGNCWLVLFSSLLAVALMLYNMSLLNSDDNKKRENKFETKIVVKRIVAVFEIELEEENNNK